MLKACLGLVEQFLSLSERLEGITFYTAGTQAGLDSVWLQEEVGGGGVLVEGDYWDGFGQGVGLCPHCSSCVGYLIFPRAAFR